MPAKGKSIVKLDSNEVIEYYNSHSKKFTCKHFGASWNRILKILRDNSITLHTRSENLKLSIYEMSDGDIESYYNNRNKKFQETISNSDNFKTNRTDKIKATKEERYGEHYNSIIGFKGVQTKKERYGSADMFHCEKANKTKLELYNDINYNNREKCAQTKLENWGDSNYNNREKMKLTKLENWGDSSYVNPEKGVQTKRDKYEVWPGTGRTLYVYNNIEFDSLPELALYLYAIAHNEPIEREPIRLEYTFNNKLYCCYPDFKYKDELVEIKGPHLIDEFGCLINPFNKDDIYEGGRLRVKTDTLLSNNVRFILLEEYNYYVNWFNEHYDVNSFRKENN